MTVLSRPINLAFELAPDKAEAFFKNKNMAKKAIERSDKHKFKVEKKENGND